MKRHRITVELQIDIPESLSAAQALSKISASSHSITFGQCKVISDSPLPETLLPYEQYDNEKIAIRNALLEAFKTVGKDYLRVKIWANTNWSNERLTHLATRPMLMRIWAKAGHPLYRKGQITVQIHSGEIWDMQNKVKISSLADPKFEGLIRFIDAYYKPKPKLPNELARELGHTTNLDLF